ncbi:unnamed protein product [Brugia pahangi]|uniref:Protein krueppel n=1 Tax=Brugia pahangi TaxID=6280 RepID=A0A0N4T9D5_BRUPA|nr:unnamed protein product [Brugia pahangi]
MMTHTSEKPHSCSICKRNFGDLRNMKRHMRTHAGEKPYSCSICKKNFTRSDSIKSHMMIHTGEKPYSCLICRKGFIHKHHLQSHMATHDMNRPVYHCTVCSKDFQAKSGLKSNALCYFYFIIYILCRQILVGYFFCLILYAHLCRFSSLFFILAAFFFTSDGIKKALKDNARIICLKLPFDSKIIAVYNYRRKQKRLKLFFFFFFFIIHK